MAVTLFEQGFSEDLIESALNVNKTLDDAVAWLRRRRKTSGGSGKEVAAVANAPATSSTNRTSGSCMSMSPAAKKRVSECPTPNSSRSGGLRISQKMETCAICFGDAQPTKAVRLACRHGWYCEHCMKMHAEARLSVGDVCVPCPECREPIQEYSLREFLAEDVMDRFHERSMKKAIASSSNLFTCPTPDCDMCVWLDDGEEPWLKKCPKCRKGSCLKCGAQPYHKGVSCQMHQLRSRNPEQKRAELSFKRWMHKTGTKQCPQCNMGITKEDISNQGTQYSECHKMMCRHCNTRFCFKCLAVLTDSFTCGCSIDRHGFVNPVTGRICVHLKKKAAEAKKPDSRKQAVAKVHAKAKAKKAPASGAKGRPAGGKKAPAKKR